MLFDSRLSMITEKNGSGRNIPSCFTAPAAETPRMSIGTCTLLAKIGLVKISLISLSKIAAKCNASPVGERTVFPLSMNPRTRDIAEREEKKSGRDVKIRRKKGLIEESESQNPRVCFKYFISTCVGKKRERGREGGEEVEIEKE